MKIEERIDMFLIDESFNMGAFKKYLSKLFKKPSNKAKKEMKSSWKELSTTLKNAALEKDAIDIINKHLKTSYKSLDQIDRLDVKNIPTQKVYEDNLNEDFKHFWEMLKSEAFPTLAFYPALTAWLELDKLLSSTGDFNATKFGLYAMFWLVLVSGKFLKAWQKWKQDKPEEFEKEGAKKNPFAVK